jgi:antitoxin ParD1/3/4
MNFELPTDQQAFLDELVSRQRYASTEDAVSDAIGLLISRERLRQQIDLGIAQADRDEVVDHDTVFTQLRNMAVAAQRDSAQ